MARQWKIRYSSLFIIFFFSYDLLYPALSLIFNTTISEYIYNICLILLMVLSSHKHKKMIKKDVMLLWLACGLFFLITYFFHPEYSRVLFEGNYDIRKTIFSLHKGLFAYLVIRFEEDSEMLFWDIKIAAFVIWIAYTIKTINGVADVQVSVWTGNTIISNYNQTYGFCFLFSGIVFLYCMVKEKILYVIPFFLVIGQILMYASRTAILSLIVYIVLFILFEGEEEFNGSSKRLIGCIMIIFAGITLTSTAFLSWLRTIVSNWGISSKIIDAFLSGNNALDGGREYLYAQGWVSIKEHILGQGAFCDRYQLGMYVHNIVIEILMDFGWIFGALIIVGLTYWIIKMLSSKSSRLKTLFLMFLSLIIVRLMLSYSFWQDNNFWIMLAIVKSYKEQENNRRRDNEKI